MNDGLIFLPVALTFFSFVFLFVLLLVSKRTKKKEAKRLVFFGYLSQINNKKKRMSKRTKRKTKEKKKLERLARK